MLLGQLVAAEAEVSATRSRTQKAERLAGLLRELAPADVEPAVGLLLGRPRQGRVGVGWRTLMAATPPTSNDRQDPLTIAKVDSALTQLAQAHGTGSTATRQQLLHDLLGRATGPERNFIIRSLTGEMRTGALEGVLVDAIARAAEVPAALARRAAMLTGDPARTASLALTDPSSLTEVGLSVGTPILPMLASPGGEVEDATRELGEASVEYKLDGARIQVHRSGNEVGVFTRSLADITGRVPEIVDVVRQLPARDVVLDGETLLLTEDGSPRPFQESMSRFGGVQAADRVLRPWFFDLLHLDGQDLLDEPLTRRRELLLPTVGELVVPSVQTADPAVAEEFARRALAAGHEGVVLKALDAPYVAGRRGKEWRKVKPVITLDLVVLAVEWGSGRRQGWLSNIHLGARDPSTGGFVMVGKTFKGMTDEILRWQTEHFPTIETRRTRSAVFVEPLTVVEVAIDGVQRSSRYPGGVALRFARVKTYRPDKSPSAADTIDTLRTFLGN
ncbi:ATP-dependent DNA ligase [Aestuariimicrobium sp. p3-SID1156]|uniref:ATP-dependent DNA ligase n=1 Tax=Aestuariimicrobium sp. p3-SID1156 TaxID=2916038 RepID=UPI00223B36B7|nr:ATP-dependent DNA ligase [Aestuariimicrobium sp. p3-SID1156]MCT1459924.1 ATP-dependent DNA ligase [Aestuariimicrobium sp. p3-SID1156]